jgi:hypothetical protein
MSSKTDFMSGANLRIQRSATPSQSIVNASFCDDSNGVHRRKRFECCVNHIMQQHNIARNSVLNRSKQTTEENYLEDRSSLKMFTFDVLRYF